jgi:hypothetical protein
MISKSMRLVMAAGFACAFAAAVTTAASAEDRWQKDHPRRVEVNHRLENLNERVRQERREGEISRGQAMTDHREIHQIRMEERAMAHHDGSHLTTADQRALNQQENAVSGQVGK